MSDTAVDTLIDHAMFAEMLATAKKSKSRFLIEVAQSAIDLANVKTLLRAARAGMRAEQIEPLLAEGGAVEPAALVPLAGLQSEALSAGFRRLPALKGLAEGPLGDLSSLDATLNAARARVLKRGRAGQVGPEPVIAYVLGRETEVATLRVLLIGGLTGIDDATLQASRRERGVGRCRGWRSWETR